MVREVSALGNIPERNPFELRANDHLVNMYIRISPGDRRLKQTVQKNLVVLVIARNYRLSSVSSRFWAYCFPLKSFIPVSSWLICRTGVVFRVFHSGGQMQEESAKGESLAQKKKIELKKVSIICRVRPSYVIRSWPPFMHNSRHRSIMKIEYVCQFLLRSQILNWFRTIERLRLNLKTYIFNKSYQRRR